MVAYAGHSATQDTTTRCGDTQLVNYNPYIPEPECVKPYRPDTMVVVKMLFWEFTVDWGNEVLFHLRSISRLEQVFKSNHLDVIRQPKPKSKLKAKLYK